MRKFVISLLILLLFYSNSIAAFNLPSEIRIGEWSQCNANRESDERRSSHLGAIFDTGDQLSRRAFEYAVARINAQSKIFPNSKIVVNQIDLVSAHDSFSAYKLGKAVTFPSDSRLIVLLSISLCAIGKGCGGDFHRPFDTRFGIRQFIDATIAHPDVSLVARSANQSRLLHSQRLSALHRHESSVQRSDQISTVGRNSDYYWTRRKLVKADETNAIWSICSSFRFTLFTRFIQITDGYASYEGDSETVERTTGAEQLGTLASTVTRNRYFQIPRRCLDWSSGRFLPTRTSNDPLSPWRNPLLLSA